MSKLNGIMKLTEAQFSELSNNGTITVGGVTYTYDPNGTLYVTDDTSGGGSGVSDVQVDSNSVVSSGIAQFSTINGNYNASTNPLATQSDLNGGGGSSQLYMHNIKISGSCDGSNGSGTQTYDMDTHISIISNSSTSFDIATLIQYLSNKGFDGMNGAYYNVSGNCHEQGTNNFCYAHEIQSWGSEIALFYTPYVSISITTSTANVYLTDYVTSI